MIKKIGFYMFFKEEKIENFQYLLKKLLRKKLKSKSFTSF